MVNATGKLCNDTNSLGLKAEIPSNYAYKDYFQVIKLQGAYSVIPSKPFDFGDVDLRIPIDITHCNGTVSKFYTNVAIFRQETTTATAQNSNNGIVVEDTFSFLDKKMLQFTLGPFFLLVLLVIVVLVLVGVRRRKEAKLEIHPTPVRIADPENAIDYLKSRHFHGHFNDDSSEPLLVPCTYDELKVFGYEGNDSQLSLSVSSHDDPNVPPAATWPKR